MSLANLTLSGMERYGAVELQKNANIYVTRGFISAVSSLSLLVGLFLCLNGQEETKASNLRWKVLTEIGPPPALQTTQKKEVRAVPPLASSRPNFGIPVPVPDLLAAKANIPPLSEVIGGSIPGIRNDTGILIGGTLVGTQPGIEQPPHKAELDPGLFVNVDVEPSPIQSIESLVVYPEVARRSGLEGKVLISALIDIDGRVIKTQIEQADLEVFKQPAIDALMKARFTPARQGNEAVQYWYVVPISFKLADK